MPDKECLSAELARAVEQLNEVLGRARGQDVDGTVLGAVDASLAVARTTVRELRRPAGPAIGKSGARSQVIEALTDLGVPAGAGLIVAYHRAVFDSDLRARGLASLRRDEARKLDGGGNVPLLVVSTLTPQFAHARGLFALSTWPGWLRVTGVYSERVNRLHAIRRMLDYRKGLPTTDERHRTAIDNVLINFGQGIEGISLAAIDAAAARAAVDHQLSILEPKDRAERESVAARLD